MTSKTFNEIDKEIIDCLEGDDKNDISKMKEVLLQLREMVKKEKEISQKTNILAGLLKPFVNEEIIEAIKGIKIEPQITVEAPKVSVLAPEPKVIMQEPPRVMVPQPKVILQERPFPEEMRVTGIAGFFKSVVDVIKSKLNVVISDNTPLTPLYVALAHNGQVYRAEGQPAAGGVIVGGSPSRISIKNKNNQIAFLPEASSSPEIYNVSMLNMNTEYSQSLPDKTKKVDIKLRAVNALLKIAFTENESGTKYIQIPYGSSLHLEGVNLSNTTIYMQSPTAAQTAEILCWI